MTTRHPDHSCPTDAYCGIILADPTFSEPLRDKLRQSIAAFQAFDQAEVPVMPYISAWRVDEKIIWYEFASQRLLRLLGCPPQEAAACFRHAVIDHRLYKFVDSAPAIKEQVLDREHLGGSARKLRELRRKTGVADAVYKLGLPDGKLVWLKDRAAIETHDQDRVCLSMGCLVDVSKEMLQKDRISADNVVMSRDKGLLVEAERHEALGQISAQVYHEIRNPIAAIGGLARRILNKGADANLQMYSEVIAKEAQRLELLLHSLFQFTQSQQLERKPAAPALLAKNALVLLQTDMEKNRIKLHFSPPEDLPELWCDIRLMEEALVHIIKNAIEALPEEGRIELAIHHDEQAVFFIVKDYGLGIRPNHSSRVTEPFFTTKVTGSGFGLSLAKKYIELHQGTLQIISTVASGTKVVVKIPVAQSGPETARLNAL